VSAARFWPRTIPLMVLDERRFVPIDVLATTFPAPLVERIALVRLVKPKFVVVAFVWIAFVEKKFVEVALPATRLVVVAPPKIVKPPTVVPLPIVEEALTMMPSVVVVGERKLFEPVKKFQVLPKLFAARRERAFAEN